MTAVVASSVRRVGENGASAWLELRDANGERGIGEACPLPGRSIDDVSACASALEGIHEELAPLDDDASAFDAVTNAVAPLDTVLEALPAARFAIETALFDLVARRRGITLAEALGGPRPYNAIGLNALLVMKDGAPVDELVAEARCAVGTGYRTLKVKLPKGDDASFDRALASLRSLRAAIPEEEIRIDVNGAFSLDVARARLAALASVTPAYVEQPVAAADLEALGDVAVPIAADESLAVPSIRERLLEGRRCAVFVLKPTLLGGLLAARRLAEHAQRRGIGVVVTHAFEGPIALAAACELALSLSRPPLACGLAPYARLASFPRIEVRQIGQGFAHSIDAAGLGLDVDV